MTKDELNRRCAEHDGPMNVALTLTPAMPTVDYTTDQNAAARIIDMAVEKKSGYFNLRVAVHSAHIVERLHHSDNTVYKLEAALEVLGA